LEDIVELKGKKIAVLVEQIYEDLELWYPKLRMIEAGAQVTVIGPLVKSYPSKHGYEAKSDMAVDQANAKDFDAIIIPGGFAPDHMRRHPKMIEFVKQGFEQKKIVAAICHAGWMLVSANIIRGKKLTGYFSIKDDLVNAGGLYEDREVVRDGNLITSRCPADLPAFCREIISALLGK